MVSTVATQSRSASLTASFSVRLPELHRAHLGAEQPHAEHVERLALGVDLSHVDDALQPEQGGRGGGGHAVLAGAGLGHQPRLAHLQGQQPLTDDVVDLVRAGVGQVLPLEQHPHPEVLGQPAALGHRGGPAGVVAQQVGVAGPEPPDRPRRPGRPLPARGTPGTSDSGT